MCLEIQFYHETSVEGRMKGRAYRERKSYMLSNVASSAKYPDVKRTAED